MKKLTLIFTVLMHGQAAFPQCTPSAQALLDINNVTAPVDNDGSIGFNLDPNVGYTIDTGNGTVSAGMTQGLWIGGMDSSGQLHLSAMRYGGQGNDYFPGPLNTATAQTDSATCAEYDRIYKIEKWRVAEFQQRLGESGYVIPEEILNWPAHGDVSQGQDYFLAPYFDLDSSGYYDANDGDYPYFDFDPDPSYGEREVKLNGDQVLFWVINDTGGPHTETGGEPIGLEIRCFAYGFNTCGPLADVTFYEYEIINRGSLILHDTYISMWMDLDAGPASDDFAQCDVQRNLGFNYDAAGNGVKVAFGIDLLSGPYSNNDNVDNDGDGIIDNEKIPMSGFLTGSTGNPAQGDPNTPTDFYNYMRGIWLDGTPMCYGGNGHISGGCNGVGADFMFPGSSDPTGIGTGGVPQLPWTEQTAGNVPGDRRFILSAGPFTMEPGSINDLHFAVIWTRDPTGQDPIATLIEADDLVQMAYDSAFTDLPCCPPVAEINSDQISPFDFFFSSITEGEEYLWDFGDGSTADVRFPPRHTYADNGTYEVILIVINDCGSDTVSVEANTIIFGLEENLASWISIFPNPADNRFSVSVSGADLRLESVKVYDAVGVPIMEQRAEGTKADVMLNLSSGMYFVRIGTNRGEVLKKIVVR